MGMKQFDFFSKKKDEEFINKNANMHDKIAFLFFIIFALLVTILKTNVFISSEKTPPPPLEFKEKKFLGENYEGIKNSLVKYQIKEININKNSTNYTVDTNFEDGTNSYSKYMFNQEEKPIGLDLKYSLNIKLLKSDNEYFLLPQGFDDMIKENLLDKEQIDEKIIPEIQYVIQRASYSYIWNQVQKYSMASFSEKEKQEFSNNFPKWAKDIAPNMVGSVLLSMKNENGVYYADPKKTIGLANMLKYQNIKAKNEDVCELIKSDSKVLEEENNIAFIENVSGKSLKQIKSMCK